MTATSTPATAREGTEAPLEGVSIPQEIINGILALYGNPNTLATSGAFAGWDWWKLIDLMEGQIPDETLASNDAYARTTGSKMPSAIALLLVQDPRFQAVLNTMRATALERKIASNREALLALMAGINSDERVERDGTSYRILPYGSPEAIPYWLKLLQDEANPDKLYELGIYNTTEGLPKNDLNVLITTTMNYVRAIGSVERFTPLLSDPCVVKTAHFSEYYPEGLSSATKTTVTDNEEASPRQLILDAGDIGGRH